MVTVTEETLSRTWDQHVISEFALKSPEQALEAMAPESYVNVVPLMTGARGRAEMRDFYANHFLSQIPSDMEMVPVSRTIGQNRVVDEMILRFTHSIRMDWLLPGIPPTNKHVELPLVIIVQFEGDKIAHEHIYWDQASVLVQVGLLGRTLPVRGGEVAAQVLHPTQPMNELFNRESLGVTGNGVRKRKTKHEKSNQKTYWLSGARFIVHASHEDAAGSFDLVEGGGPPGFQAPLHRHTRYAEQIYVTEGEWTVWAGKRKAVLHPGDAFTVPIGTAHTVAVTGDGPGRALVFSSPRGFAHLIAEVGTPDDGDEVPPSATTDMDLLLRISAEVGDEILGPPGALPDEFAGPRGER